MSISKWHNYFLQFTMFFFWTLQFTMLIMAFCISGLTVQVPNGYCGLSGAEQAVQLQCGFNSYKNV